MLIKNSYTYALLFPVLMLISTGCAQRVSPTITAGQTREAIQATKKLEPSRTLLVGNTPIRVAIARTPEEQTQGLSGITSLPDNEGMLFPFSPQATPSFWMKDMLLAIDIIWIRDGQVIGISHNLPPVRAGTPRQDMELYPAPGKIDHVLEVAAGWSARHSVVTGTKVEIK